MHLNHTFQCNSSFLSAVVHHYLFEVCFLDSLLSSVPSVVLLFSIPSTQCLFHISLSKLRDVSYITLPEILPIFLPVKGHFPYPNQGSKGRQCGMLQTVITPWGKVLIYDIGICSINKLDLCCFIRICTLDIGLNQRSRGRKVSLFPEGYRQKIWLLGKKLK